MTPPFPPGTQLVGYLRDSGGREQDVSVDRQKAEISAWAHDQGLVITRWFADAARSGTSLAGRDQFLELNSYLSRAKQPEAGVVVWEYARLARQYDDASYYLADLRRQGYTVYSLTDAIPDTLDGRLLDGIISWKNAKYSESLSRAIKSGFHFIISAYKGYPGSEAPLGYRKEPMEIGKRRDGFPHWTAQLVPDESLAPLVRQAFEMRASGSTYAEIHNALHLTRSHLSLNHILANRIYTGTLVFGGEEYSAFCDPIVSVETFEAAQATNRARAGRHGYDHPRRARSRFLLTGLLRCARCGSLMNGDVVLNHDYYTCQNVRGGKAASCHAPRLPKEEIEGKTLRAIENFLQPEVLGPLLKKEASGLSRRQGEHARKVERTRKELARTEAAIQRIVKAVADAGHSQALLSELDILERKRNDLAVDLAEAERSAPKAIEVRDEDLAPFVAQLRDQLRGKPGDSRAVLRGLVVSMKAERVGGSPVKHRGGDLAGQITLRPPIGDGEAYIINL